MKEEVGIKIFPEDKEQVPLASQYNNCM